MAIAIAFGLMGATLIILMVLPCIMVIAGDLRDATYYLWNGTPRPVIEREPAHAGE